jgi:hypothetical protein
VWRRGTRGGSFFRVPPLERTMTLLLNGPHLKALQSALPMPREWPPAKYDHGILFIAVDPNASSSAASSCIEPMQQPEMKRGKKKLLKRGHGKLSQLTEAALSTAFLRVQVGVKLPIALAADSRTCQFVKATRFLHGLWDQMVSLDVGATRAALQPLAPGLVNESFGYLCKLICLARSPFRRSVFLDNDMWIMSKSVIPDLLHASLRLYDMAMPVDPGRPGCDEINAVPALNQRPRDLKGMFAQPKPGYARGFPPLCSCMMAFKRVPKTLHLFRNAALRLLARTNPTDPTNSSIKLRQSDQEMIWFELMEGVIEEQPSVLVLPEEYYCPALFQSRYAIHIVQSLAAARMPFWGDMGAWPPRTMQDRYLPGGTRYCHAVHSHFGSEALLTRFRLARLLEKNGSTPGSVSGVESTPIGPGSRLEVGWTKWIVLKLSAAHKAETGNCLPSTVSNIKY